MTVHRRMSEYVRPARDFGGRSISRGNSQKPVGTVMLPWSGAKFLYDPRGETNWGVSERERKGLRPRPLDPLVASLFLARYFRSSDVGFATIFGSRRNGIMFRLIPIIRSPCEYASREVMKEPQSPPWAPKRL
jgi:hypothetical protein